MRYFDSHKSSGYPPPIAQIFQAIVNKDIDGFKAGLDKLLPSLHDRMVSVVMLSKLANKLYKPKHTENNPASLWSNGRDLSLSR